MTKASNNGLDAQGVVNAKAVHWNLAAEPLYEATIRGNHGQLSKGGALVVDTGKHTGRSPKSSAMAGTMRSVRSLDETAHCVMQADPGAESRCCHAP